MWFSSAKNTGGKRCGVVLDVGSGSVAAAIVLSDDTQKHPEILWSYREHLSESRNQDGIETRIRTAILNVFLELGADGLRNLRAKYPRIKKPSLIQASISAPFSYTLSRHIKTSIDKPIKISDRFIINLEKKVTKEAKDQVVTTSLSKTLGLSLLANTSVSLAVNGYKVEFPYRGMGQSVALTQLVSLAATSFVKQIEDARDKVLPGVLLDTDSFMSLYYRVLSSLSPFSNDLCLISVTAEATEVMVVRDGHPSNSYSIQYGQHTLAREISLATGLTFSESLSITRECDVDCFNFLTPEKQGKADAIIAKYEAALFELFRKVGDSLTIPKVIYLHSSGGAEDYLGKLVSNATTKISSLQPQVYPVTSNFFNFGTPETDLGILCTAYVFHKKLYEDNNLG